MWLEGGGGRRRKESERATERGREEERRASVKLRVIRRQNYLARDVRLYVELLAGNNAFRGPHCLGPVAHTQIQPNVVPTPTKRSTQKQTKKAGEGGVPRCLLELGHPRNEGVSGGGVRPSLEGGGVPAPHRPGEERVEAVVCTTGCLLESGGVGVVWS